MDAARLVKCEVSLSVSLPLIFLALILLTAPSVAAGSRTGARNAAAKRFSANDAEPAVCPEPPRAGPMSALSSRNARWRPMW